MAAFAIFESQITPAVAEFTGAPWWSRALWAVGSALPWAVGAAALAWARPQVGTSVLVSLAVLGVPGVFSATSLLFQGSGTIGSGLWVAGLGQVVAWIAGCAAGLLAWLDRPEGAWRIGAPGPGALFTTAAIMAWLPTAFRSTAFAPPGAPRRFVEPLLVDLDLGALPGLLTPLVVAIVLLVAPRLTEAVAGAVTLTFAVPQFLAHAVTIRAGVEQDAVIPTPPGVLGLLGVATLVTLGLRWLLRSRRDLAPRDGPGR